MMYVFITGTGKGLGKALAEVLLEEKQNTVHGISRHQSIQHTQYIHTTLDLSREERVKDFRFEQVQADKIVLVNNAGSLGDVQPLGRLDGQSIVDTFMINSIAPALLINSFINTYRDVPAMKIIINVSSGAAQTPYDGWSEYCSSKAALEMLTHVGSQEQELQKLPYPFVFLSIAPGVVDTDMQAQTRSLNNENFSRHQKFKDLKEKGELLDPYDVAREYVRIINDPSIVKGVTHRVSL